MTRFETEIGSLSDCDGDMAMIARDAPVDRFVADLGQTSDASEPISSKHERLSWRKPTPQAFCLQQSEAEFRVHIRS